MIIDVPKVTPGEIVIGLNDRQADRHDVYRINIGTGEKDLPWKNDQNVADWVIDLEVPGETARRAPAGGGPGTYTEEARRSDG